MIMEETTAENLLLKMPYGAMLFEMAEFKGKQEVVFMIREEKKTIHEWPSTPLVESRSGIFVVQDVALIPVMIMVGRGRLNQLYEAWINVCAGPFYLEYLQTLVKQDNIKLLFYDRIKERAIQAGNTLQSIGDEYIAAIKNMESWTMNTFNEAREVIYKDFPSPVDLWGRLGEVE